MQLDYILSLQQTIQANASTNKGIKNTYSMLKVVEHDNKSFVDNH